MTVHTALPAIVAGPPPGYFFSASQVETFMGCPRKWGWKYIAGIKPTQATSAQVGDACHKELEKHLGGEPIDFTLVVHGVRIGDVIAPGLGLLPVPCTPGMKIEGSFSFPSKRGRWSWTGRKDLECTDGADFPTVDGVPIVPTGCPVVSDHKSTSDAKWAKTPDALKWDVQANLYAYELLHGTCMVHDDCKTDAELARACAATNPQQPAVDLVWTYYQTRGAKKAKRVHLRVLRDHADEAFARIETIAARMAKHHDEAACELDKGAYVQSMTPNPGQCDAYGGCPYQGECQLTITERFSASMSTGNDFFSNLANVAAAQDAVAAPATTAPLAVPETLPTWATALVDPLRERQAAPAPMVMPSTPPTASGFFASAQVDPNTRALTHATPIITDCPINPPESLLPPPVTAPPSIVQTLTVTPDAPVEEKPKRGRGRPRKPVEPSAIIHNLPAPTAPVTALQAAADADQAAADADQAAHAAPAEQVNVTERVQRTDDTPASFALFVDCLPDGLTVIYADHLIAMANAIVVQRASSSEKPVAHYRFLDYGKGAGALDIALQQILSNHTPEAIFCASTSDALPTLTKLAGCITRAVR